MKANNYFIFIMILLANKSYSLDNTAECKKIIDQYYNTVSGFGISKEDEEHIKKNGCASTYGEITCDSVEKLINYLQPKKTDVFADAGCGVGKLVIQFLLSSPVKKSIGIELSKERYNKALTVKEALRKDKKLPDNRILEFYNDNILNVNLNEVTIFFMCSTCFSSELMQQITAKLATLKPGLRIITLKSLPDNKNFKLITTMNLPMTWSSSTPVHIYELVK